MSQKFITLRTRRFKGNPLLKRRQFILDVHHPGYPNVSKADLKEKLGTMYNIDDLNTIFVFGFKTSMGGGKSTGFGVIYDTLEAAKKFEPKYRLARQGLIEHNRASRKQIKEKKNRNKKNKYKKFKKNKQA
eukprot:TRINITY_DN1429_c1_g2_i1.p1 TRINITY_DN1429_c1_g2~~TRINITY_DN1429_c1_g2_i1.p1  ORF type:complete len:131 (-),score=26.54 TRINITY_DN1429_c1_g2_i1:97-489(-)